MIDIKQSVLGRKMASNHGYYWRNSHIPIDSISMKACFYNRDQNALSACKATAHNVEGCFLQAPPIQAVLIRPQSRARGREEGGVAARSFGRTIAGTIDHLRISATISMIVGFAD